MSTDTDTFATLAHLMDVNRGSDVNAIVRLACSIIWFNKEGQIDLADHVDRLRYLGLSASIIGATLEKADAPAEVVEAWKELAYALADLERGRSPGFLAPGTARPPKGSGLLSKRAIYMAFGAAAIELTPRGQKAKIREAAARRLGVTAGTLGDFHKNLKGGKIKDETALTTFEAAIKGYIRPGLHGVVYGAGIPADAESWVKATKKVA